MQPSYKKEKAYAIVVGLDTMQGIQTARILAGHDIPVIAIARNPKHHCCRTRVCDDILFADTAGDGLVETLARLGPRLQQKAVIYPCQDICVSLISQNREILGKWFHVMLADADVIEMLMGKESFYRYAHENGFLVPKTIVLRCTDDAEQAAKEIEYPCVLKPTRRSATWDAETTSKGFKLSDAEELLRTYGQVEQWADTFIVQHWIEGNDATLYSCNCYFDRNSKLVASFIAKKIRQWPPQAGSSCLGEECRNDTVLSESIRLFDTIGYRGLGYVESKHDERSGKYYLIEANLGRPTGRSAIAEAGGVDMLYAMYCDAVGLPLPTDLEQRYSGVKWLDFRHDLQAAVHYWRRGELTLREWWNSWRGPKAHAYFSWSDPGPFLADIGHAVRIMVSRKEWNRRRRKIPARSVTPEN